MKIGYCVQGAADAAFVIGLRDRYCPDAKLVPGKARGKSGASLRREIRKNLIDLTSHHSCDYIVMLTDADESAWLDVHKREWRKVPVQYQHFTVFGVADRNIGCWIALDRQALASEIDCRETEIPKEDPSSFIDRRFGISRRDVMKDAGKRRLAVFVKNGPFKVWIQNSRSFKHFWLQILDMGKRNNCPIPNEQND